MKDKIINKFKNLGKSLKRYFLGPNYFINAKKIKEKDPNNLVIFIALPFAIILMLLLRRPDNMLADFVYAFTNMGANGLNIALTVLLSVGLASVSGLGIYFANKKKYLVVSDAISLPLFAFMLYYVTIESIQYGIDETNWLLWFVMIIPQLVMTFGLGVKTFRFFMKWFIGKTNEERLQDFKYRLVLQRKWLNRLGIYFKHNWGQILIIIALIIFAMSVLYPLMILIIRSLKYPIEDLKHPFDIPTVITFDNYVFMWDYLKDAFINSLITTICVTFGTMILAALLAYAFIRFQFPFKNVLFYVIIALMMIPGILTLISRFEVVNEIKLVGSLSGIILPGIAGFIPGSFLLLFTFFKGLPKDLFEAADMDGANNFTVFARIVTPMSKPILSTIAIQTFVGEWNDYLWASLIVGNDETLYTLPVLLQRMSSMYEELYLGMSTPFAGYVLSAIPMALIFIVASKQFIEGLTSGAFKM